MSWHSRYLSLLFPVLLLAIRFPMAANAQASPTRSIHNWVRCDGKSDDNAGVTAAFAAAKNDAFTLVVDCPVFIHVGTDIRRPIFIDNGTTVQFTKNGLFKVDNADIPAFVIANSEKIRLLGWQVQYVGGLPIAKSWTGYYDNGAFIQGKAWPSSSFTDIALTQWLVKNRNIHFAQPAPWGGLTNTSAIFYFVGSTKNVEVRNLRMFVAPDAKGSHFIPMAFSLLGSWNSNQTMAITRATPINTAQYSVPSNLTFSDIDLDGYYMGWQGTLQNSLIEHVRAHRYGDLQDDQGGEVGGVGKWFAPPHLFYLNYDLKQTGLENRNIRILDVIDYGNRVGVARDKGGADPGSGFANSLKIGAFNSLVDGYQSYRPDGFLDLLASRNLTISNVQATYDSSFLNGLYPAIRFPQAPYQNVTLENITIVDKAPVPKQTPIWNTYSPQNSQVTMKNVRVTLNSWAKAPASLCPHIAGVAGNKVDIQFIVSGHLQRCTQP
ncbi:MAG TPA: hypothetical protein VMA71_03850 [Alloacidobacterium sp.]|nr:hypothetical protein [Alloacidobacterium sp.]